jgi:hypothetical protein
VQILLQKKRLFGGLLLSLLAIVSFALLRPVEVPVNGLLRQSNGNPVSDGYYDLRVVGFNAESGLQTIEQDFQDVFVSGGRY